MKRPDVIIIAIILLAAAVGLVLMMGAQQGNRAEITSYGESMTVSLNEEKTFTIQTIAGYNEVQVKNGTIRVAAADCPDGLCIHQGAKSKAGETIVCLPHELVIRILGDGHVDAVAE